MLCMKVAKARLTRRSSTIIACTMMYLVRIRRKYKLCVVVTFFISLGIILSLLMKVFSSFSLLPTLAELTELEKCPTCFGVTMCPAFMGGSIQLIGFDTFSYLLNVIGSKNVLYGRYGSEKVVLKKLGHNWELQQLDEKICGELDFDVGCQVNEAVWRIDDLRFVIARRLSPQASKLERTDSLRLCPSARNMDTLLKNVLHRNRGIDARIMFANIWTLILLNPEPLILQILPEEEGWPVPKYYGACGRVVIEEYAGEILTSFYDAPWIFRANLALQLLVAATSFTNKHPDFSFYLTDVSPDNIAVDSRGKLKFIDLENVIIVDKNVPEKEMPISWNVPHSTESYDCKNCFAFSADDICSHRISDHNYYAVCQHLLAPDSSSDLIPGGLLHGISKSVLKSHPQLPELLRQCAHPSQSAGRFQASRELTILLANITASNA